MAKGNISFRLDEDKRVAIDAIAASIDRDRSYILNEAVAAYLEMHKWQLEEIKKAMAEAATGKFAADEQVEKFFAKWCDE